MINIGSDIILDISRDGLEAYMTIKNEPKEDLTKHKDAIFDKIKNGLDENLVNRALNYPVVNERILIAKGLPPIDGKDGSIKYHFEMDKPLVPKILPDGTVDYRELDKVNSAEKDQILAEVIPPQEGSDGIKVTGEVISHKKGRMPKIRSGKNAMLSFDGTHVIANTAGLIELKNGRISILEVLKLDNIDSESGNIYFDGDIIINKDVMNGFKVEATRNVEIKGAVEGGCITCGGNILIRQGIQGYNRESVNVGGDFASKFIENAIIHSGGNITSEAIMHSSVYSDKNILVIGKKGLIVGGNIKATNEIVAKVVGSSMATATVLEVGIEPDITMRYKELALLIDQTSKNQRKINQSLKLLESLKEKEALDEKKSKLYEELTRARTIISKELNGYNMEYSDIKTLIDKAENGKIKISDTIYPGVKIIIGNAYMFVRDEMKRCTFYKEGSDIRVGPY